MFLELLDGADEDGVNEAIDCICKAAAQGDASVWAPHPSKFIASLVEAFTDNGVRVSAAMAAELVDWLTGKMQAARYIGAPKPPPFPWAQGDLAKVHAYLAGKPLAQWGFADWSMLGDYIVSVHMPPDFIQGHASWMAARATLMGKLEAQKAGISAAAANNALASLPSSVDQAVRVFALTPAEVAAMEYAAARCADFISGVSDSLRSSIKSAILQEMVQPHVRGVPSSSLQTKLLDAFGRSNLDWRRIAVTEAGEAKNQGFIASLPPGARVRRFEQYLGACSFCAGLNGKTYTVVAPDAPDKDGWSEVWAGKSNVGRSSSPTRIVNGAAVSRTEDELWWPAAGVQHPHCRGMWVLETDQAASLRPSTGNGGTQTNWGAWLSAIGLS